VRNSPPADVDTGLIEATVASRVSERCTSSGVGHKVG
jgi:hypothetical protein